MNAVSRYQEALTRLPAPGTGTGFNLGLLPTAAEAKRAGRTYSDFCADVTPIAAAGSRPVSEKEIRRAWERANPGHQAGRSTAPATRGANVDIESLPTTEESEISDRSPVKIPEVSLEQFKAFLPIAFPDPELVFIGNQDHKAEPGRNILTAAEWLKQRKVTGKLILANPLTGKSATTSDGKQSYRAEACVADFRHLVVEFDETPPDQQLSIARWFIEHGPVAWITFSGNKSYHVVLRIDAENAGDYKRKVDLLRPFLLAIGADRACWHPGRLTRLPGATRGNGKLQKLLYLNPLPEKTLEDLLEAFKDLDPDRPRVMYADEILAADVQVTPVIDGLLNQGGGMILAGRDGVGKSLVSLEFAVTAARAGENGLFLWGTWPVMPAKSLFVQAENNLPAIRDRLQKMVPTHLREKVMRKLAFFAIRDNLRVAKDILDRNFQAEIVRLLRKMGGNPLWFLDPLTSFHTAEENSAAMRPVLDAVTAINDATGATVVIVHHLGKGGLEGGLRGHTAIRDWCHAAVLMERQEDETIKIVNPKNRDYPRTPDFYVTRDDETFLCRRVNPFRDQAHEVATILDEIGGEIGSRKDFCIILGERLGISETTARRRIDAAAKAGSIRARRQGKATGYHLPDDAFSQILGAGND